MRFSHLVGLLGAVWIASPASSATLSYEITGYVTQLNGSAFPDGVALGDPFHARFDFDSLGEEIFPSASGTNYALTGWALSLGPLEAQLSSVPVLDHGYISKSGVPGGWHDFFQFHGQQEHRSGPTSYDTVRILVWFRDGNEQNGPFDPSLPFDGFDHYEEQFFVLDHYGYRDGVNYSISTATGVITSITLIPEPSSLALTWLGLLLLARHARSWRR